MQKLVKEYLDERNRRHRKSRRVGIAVLLLAVIVAGSVMSILTQYGIAMTGKAQCGFKEHEHGKDCYEEALVCSLQEGMGHTHTDECRPPKELNCGQEESAGGEEGTEAAISEGHTHTDACYAVPEGFLCGMEESEDHTHTDACYTVPEGFLCGMEEGEGHTHTDDCLLFGKLSAPTFFTLNAPVFQMVWINIQNFCICLRSLFKVSIV